MTPGVGTPAIGPPDVTASGDRPVRVLEALDYHTEGEPMRIVRDGGPDLPGATMLERSQRFARAHDDLRRLVLFEPRGHAAMCAAFLVPPSDPEADTGIVFVEPLGVVHMCGHGAIAIATMLVETGRVVAHEPYSALLDGTVGVAGVGTVSFDLAYGGHFYALVAARPLGFELVPSEAPRLVETGERIRAAIEAEFSPVHPEGEQAKGMVYVQFYGPARTPGATLRNAVVVAPAGLDRSPCGTGTSARLANLWARRAIGIDQAFVHESIIGSRFEGRIVGTTRVGPYEAVIPEVRGRAWLSAMTQLVLKADDPFPNGFLL